jgi:hypothetical protein
MNDKYHGWVIAAVLMALLTACDGGGSSSPIEQSGIVGIVVAGPQCPVEVIGHPCPPRPVSATVTVLAESGQTVATFTSDTQGRFQVGLPPGAYKLVTRKVHQPQLLHPVRVTVESGTQTQLRLFLDTGIR